MKYYKITFLLFLTPLISLAVNDTIYFNNNWKETKSKKKAEYYRIVDLLPNENYKCTDFYMNNNIQMLGFYKDQNLEEQDSTFDFFSENGLLIRHYKVKEGQVDFAYETLIVDSIITDTIYFKIDTMAIFHDGDEDINAFLTSYIKYPSKAKLAQISGVVRLSFIIDEFGQINDVHVEESLGFGCDEAAIEVVKLMPHWTPAIYNGRKVKCKLFLPIRFRL